MSPLAARLIPPLLVREGGGAYTDRTADRGGPTRWGVTAAELGKWRELGRPATGAEVMALGKPEALSIYEAEFIIRPGFDKVALISEPIAEEMFDTGVNGGPGLAVDCLQRSLNLCNRRGRDFPDVMVDRSLGPASLGGLTALVAKRGLAQTEALMLRCLNGFQFMHFAAITERGGPNSDQEENFCGWILGRIGLA